MNRFTTLSLFKILICWPECFKNKQNDQKNVKFWKQGLSCVMTWPTTRWSSLPRTIKPAAARYIIEICIVQKIIIANKILFSSVWFYFHNIFYRIDEIHRENRLPIRASTRKLRFRTSPPTKNRSTMATFASAPIWYLIIFFHDSSSQNSKRVIYWNHHHKIKNASFIDSSSQNSKWY